MRWVLGTKRCNRCRHLHGAERPKGASLQHKISRPAKAKQLQLAIVHAMQLICLRSKLRPEHYAEAYQVHTA